ncbi:MAG: hypothetical protein ACP5GI_05765, partial [Sulfolobales archaeon]
INLFSEDPLVVGEVTIRVDSVEEAKEEINKLLRRIDIARNIYRKEPVLKILAVSRASPEASKLLRELARENNIRLILREEVEEYL